MRNLDLTGALSDVGFLICERDSQFVAALGDIRAVLVDEPLPDPLGVHRRHGARGAGVAAAACEASAGRQAGTEARCV